MKKLQIMIEDELFAELKIAAFKNGKSMKDLVTEILNAYMGPISTSDSEPIKQEPVKTEE